MNNGSSDTAPLGSLVVPTTPPPALALKDELFHLKRELLQAEVRLAKARAAAAGAEVDIKVLNTRLKAFAK